MAEEGERATRMAPARIEIATRQLVGMSCMKGMRSASMKTVRLPRMNVLETSPTVTHAMLLNRLRSSLR